MGESVRDSNVLSWEDYLSDGGQLTYPQWVQCLIDSGNITREIGDKLISNYRQLYQPVYSLRFYSRERDLFSVEFITDVTQGEASRIVKKLSRHFKFRAPEIDFKYNSDRGLAKLGGWVMNLPKSPNLGIVLHELAHFYNQEKYHNSNHNKKLMRTLERFVNYCRKKNYWRT